MSLRLILDTKELDEIQDEVRTMGPRIRRKYLKDAGNIILEELQASARMLTRSRMKGFVRRDERKKRLADSFNMRVTFKQNEGQAVIVNPKPYAWIHEVGGVIRGRPKLVIPKTGMGMENPTWGTMYRGRLDAGNKELFIKDDIIWKKRQGKGKNRGKRLALFALKEQVVIPTRQYITRAMWRATPRIDAMLGQMEIWSG